MGRLMMVIAVTLLFVCFESTLSDVVCRDTVILERGERATVSCAYSPNFIAVFWYKDEAENPFLRLEGGRPTIVGGYDISVQGDMIIEHVAIEDDGYYRISVLDANGVSQSDFIRVNVTVPLSSDPVIQRCITADTEVCHTIEDGKMQDSLICQTTNTRPEAVFVWSPLSTSDSVRSYSYLNATTGLYTSYSTFQYDSSSFSLRYITCKVSGLAVKDVRKASIFVEGSKVDKVDKQSSNEVQEGSSLTLKCVVETSALRKWSYIDSGGNGAVLKRIYPGQESGSCLSRSNCRVENQSFLEMSHITYKDEGTYECVYSNEHSSGRSVTMIEVIITPEPPAIIIEGCKNQADCEKDVGLTGELRAFIYGSRPPAEIFCEVVEGSTSQAYIFDHHNSFEEHPQTGTFDTVYTVKYDIQKCSEPVHVRCTLHETMHTNVVHSQVYLATDQSQCSNHGKPGLIAFGVILVIVIVLTLLAIWKRDIVRTFVQKHWSCKKAGEPDVEESNTEETTAFLQERSKDVQTTGSEQPSLCDQFCHVVKDNKTFPREEFEKLMDSYSAKQEHRKPDNPVVNHLKSFHHDKEVIPAIMEYLASLIPSPLIPSFDFCNLLAYFMEQNTLAVGKFFELTNNLLKLNEISVNTYKEITGSLLKSSPMNESSLISNLKTVLTEKLITKEQLAEIILHYYCYYKMPRETALRKVQELQKSPYEVPYPYFLQGIFNCKHEALHDQDKTLLLLYNDVIKENIVATDIQQGLLMKPEGNIRDNQTDQREGHVQRTETNMQDNQTDQRQGHHTKTGTNVQNDQTDHQQGLDTKTEANLQDNQTEHQQGHDTKVETNVQDNQTDQQQELDTKTEANVQDNQTDHQQGHDKKTETKVQDNQEGYRLQTTTDQQQGLDTKTEANVQDNQTDQQEGHDMKIEANVQDNQTDQQPGDVKKTESNVENNQSLSFIYVQGLMYSASKGSITFETCFSMIGQGVEKRTIPASDYIEGYKRSVSSEWMSDTQYLNALRTMSNKNLINQDQLTNMLHLLLDKHRINHSQFREGLHEMLKTKQLSSDRFKNVVVKEIFTKKANRDEWIMFTIDLWRENLISKEEKAGLMVAIAETYLILRDDFKPILEKNMGMSVDERRAFLKPISFNDDSVSTKLKELKKVTGNK